jgi:hypothetical protein
LYGIAKFYIRLRLRTAFLGQKFDIQEPKTILPPCLQFIRETWLNVCLHPPNFTWRYPTRMLVDSLSSGLYNLRDLRICGVSFPRFRMFDIIDACIQDPDNGFGRILWANLYRLRTLRGVTLHSADIDVPWKSRAWLHRIKCYSGHSHHTIKRLFKTMDRHLRRSMRWFAKELINDPDVSHTEESLTLPDIGNLQLS